MSQDRHPNFAKIVVSVHLLPKCIDPDCIVTLCISPSLPVSTVYTSEYVYLPAGTSELCHAENFQWRKDIDVYLVMTGNVNTAISVFKLYIFYQERMSRQRRRRSVYIQCHVNNLLRTLT